MQVVTAERPTYDVTMRARVEPEPTVVVVRRRLPRPVVWLCWLGGALLGSVLLGFLAGLARPREPDPWTPGPPTNPPPRRADETAAPATAAPELRPQREDD